jgi:diadenosine tetraphosphate (Ap4A) HIT family hydrolase
MPAKKNPKLLDMDNARHDDQREYMQEIIEAGVCPFCLDQIKHKYNKEPVIKETKYWLLAKNHWPYVHTKLHLIAIYRKHAENIDDLDPEAGQDLFELVQWVNKNYDLPGGAVTMRFGDSDYSASSVVHIHAHIIVPDIEDPNYLDKPVRFKIGKTTKKTM